MRPRNPINILMGLFSPLFGSKEYPIQKENLVGNWEVVKLNNEPLNMHGFTSIRMSISSDSIHITTIMKTFGSITTESAGPWELNGKIFKSKIGDNFRKSEVKFLGENLIFSPDPLFKEDAVFKSEYKKAK